MKKINLLLFPILFILFSQCKKHKEDVAIIPPYDKQSLLDNLGNNIILPSYQNFYLWTDSLSKVSAQFIAQPTEVNLLLAQNTWKVASSYWAQAEIFRFGPVDDLLLEASINSWPINGNNIEAAINTSANINTTYIESKSAYLKGLKGIEYLLFNRANGNSFILNKFGADTLGSKRKKYLLALSQNLNQKAQIVYNAWHPSGGDYIQTFMSADGNDVNSSLGKLVNQMVYATESIKNLKLGAPLGKLSKGGIAKPDEVEAGESENSIADIKDNLKVLENIFLGRSLSGKDKNGLDDMLNYQGARYNGQLLTDAIKAKFDTANIKMDAIHTALQDAVLSDPQAVQAAYDSVKDLLIILKVDLISNLGLLLTFSDNDGD